MPGFAIVHITAAQIELTFAPTTVLDSVGTLGTVHSGITRGIVSDGETEGATVGGVTRGTVSTGEVAGLTHSGMTRGTSPGKLV